ncbi:hypothetical protein [Pyrococcus kukulkanii]|uniref:hypothetical protein n=1 Tax=Pyrococcus kukulkanii TaxID=1609559 RepID=UPI003567DEA2
MGEDRYLLLKFFEGGDSMESGGFGAREWAYRQVREEIVSFVTGRKKKPTLNQILKTVKSYLSHGLLSREDITQILAEIEEGVKSGAIAPMSSGREERFNEVKVAIEALIKNL